MNKNNPGIKKSVNGEFSISSVVKPKLLPEGSEIKPNPPRIAFMDNKTRKKIRMFVLCNFLIFLLSSAGGGI